MTDAKNPPAPESKADPLTTHHLGLLVEMFEGHKRTLLEAMDARFAAFERSIEERFAQIHLRLDVLELAVRRNSEDIERLAIEVASIRDRLVHIEARLDEPKRDVALRDLERRVEAIEAHLGLTRT